MSVHYTVRPCNSGEHSLVDDDVDEDISDYYDEILLQPRGVRPQNGTVLVRVCKKVLANKTTSQNITVDRTKTVHSACELRRVPVESLKKVKAPVDAGIPADVLEKIEKDGHWTASGNRTELGRSRQKKQADRNQTEEDASSGILPEGILLKNVTEYMEDVTDPGEEENPKDSNDISLISKESLSNTDSTKALMPSKDQDQEFVSQNHIFAEPLRLSDDLLDLDYNFTDVNPTQINLSLEYDDYNDQVCLLLDNYLAPEYQIHFHRGPCENY